MEYKEIKTIIDQISTIIQREMKPEKIILFGSYAYGAPAKGSDIDLLIIKDIPKNQVRKQRLLARKKLRAAILQYDIDIDIIIDSQQRIEERKALGDMFLKEITEKGKIVYAQ